MAKRGNSDIQIYFGKSLLRAIQRGHFPIAHIARDLGINRAAIYQYIHSQKVPTFETAYRLALYLNFSLDDIEFKSNTSNDTCTNALKFNLERDKDIGLYPEIQDRFISACQSTRHPAYSFGYIIENVFQAVFMKSDKWKNDSKIQNQAYPLLKLLVDVMQSLEEPVKNEQDNDDFDDDVAEELNSLFDFLFEEP